ncbi:MAG TPA: hypothetical protein PLP33_07290 [Leptospiraceae bacterium]|nr:hypothetical protein [Leptospiraceae bacterium]
MTKTNKLYKNTEKYFSDLIMSSGWTLADKENYSSYHKKDDTIPLGNMKFSLTNIVIADEYIDIAFRITEDFLTESEIQTKNMVHVWRSIKISYTTETNKVRVTNNNSWGSKKFMLDDKAKEKLAAGFKKFIETFSFKD